MTGGPPPLFSHRYGLATVARLAAWCAAGGEELTAELWRCRHVVEVHAWEEPDPRFRCVCPGGDPMRGVPAGARACKQRASQEDRLCDACREYCWAVRTGAGEAFTRVRLVDLYGPWPPR